MLYSFSLNLGWAIQGQSETCCKANPEFSWLCASGHCHAERWSQFFPSSTSLHLAAFIFTSILTSQVGSNAWCYPHKVFYTHITWLQASASVFLSKNLGSNSFPLIMYQELDLEENQILIWNWLQYQHVEGNVIYPRVDIDSFFRALAIQSPVLLLITETRWNERLPAISFPHIIRCDHTVKYHALRADDTLTIVSKNPFYQ